MREQVSVDDVLVIIGSMRHRCNYDSADVISNLLGEYERLKRLDENRRKLIENYKECVNGKFGQDYKSKIELLESLDK